MWLTKDPTLPEPLRPDPKGEQGSYIFFDFRRWEKVRVSCSSLSPLADLFLHETLFLLF